MSDIISFNIACPDCGSDSINKPVNFDFENNFTDVTCASCGRSISKDDVLSQADEIALQKAEEIAKSIFGDDISLN